MPSKFSKYWARIDNSPKSLSNISAQQQADLKEMVRAAFHRGIHIEGERNRVPELLDSLAYKDKRITKLEADRVQLMEKIVSIMDRIEGG